MADDDPRNPTEAEHARWVAELLRAYAPHAPLGERATVALGAIADDALFALGEEVAAAEERAHLALTQEDLYDILNGPARMSRSLLIKEGFSEELIDRLVDVGASLRAAAVYSEDFATQLPSHPTGLSHHRKIPWRVVLVGLALTSGVGAGVAEKEAPQTVVDETHNVVDAFGIASGVLTLTDPRLFRKDGGDPPPFVPDPPMSNLLKAADAAEKYEIAVTTAPSSPGGIRISEGSTFDGQLKRAYESGGRQAVTRIIFDSHPTTIEPTRHRGGTSDRST